MKLTRLAPVILKLAEIIGDYDFYKLVVKEAPPTKGFCGLAGKVES